MAKSAAAVEWCYQRLLIGEPTATLVTKAANHWGVSARQARRYVSCAYQRMKADWEAEGIDKPAYLTRLLQQLETAAQQGIEDRNGSITIGAVKQISRLLGIGADWQQHPTHYPHPTGRRWS
jgi:hypothetical protein